MEELIIISLLSKAEVAPVMFSTGTGVYANRDGLVRRYIEDLEALMPPPEKKEKKEKKNG